jgi:hypothetical protein
MINDAAHAARLAIQRHQNTHRYENTHLVGHVGDAVPGVVHGVPSITAGSPAGADTQGSRSDAPDLMEQLRQLGQLRDAGILTEEEFTSKKAEILLRL